MERTYSPTKTHQPTRAAGPYRWELAKVYLKRRKDETDWEAAFLLLDQALEVLKDDDERAIVRCDYVLWRCGVI